MCDSVELKFPVVAHQLKDREEMARLDASIAGVPGLKMCL